MRVISGTARGRRLVAPEGSTTRPTPDRVREATFNALGSLGAVVDATVLDLFAGSGALGIEALSRGAARGVFVEKDTRTAALIGENLALTGFSGLARVVRADAERLELASLGPFDLVFADPPYALVLGSRALAALASVLAEGGVAVVEHGIDEPPPTPGGLEAFDRREYGSTGVTFYRRAT